MTGSRTSADDLVQDVFFRILKYRKHFSKREPVQAWMFHIARNARFDHYKKRQAETPLPEDGIQNLQKPVALSGSGTRREQQAWLLECALFHCP